MLITIEDDMFNLLNIYAGFAGQTTEQLANLLIASALQVLAGWLKEKKMLFGVSPRALALRLGRYL
jgi:hypothetical protein